MVESCKKLPAWRALVTVQASTAMGGRPPIDAPLHLDVTFVFPRPKCHYLKSGLRPNAPTFHTSSPDKDKLMRAVGDAGTGVVWSDDSRIASSSERKVYGDKPGALVVVTLADPMLHA